MTTLFIPIVILLGLMLVFSFRSKAAGDIDVCERCGVVITHSNFGKSETIMRGDGISSRTICLCYECAKHYYISGKYNQEGDLYKYNGIKHK